jgi:hypothetical protein
MSMPHYTNIYQLHLFASPDTMEIPQKPLWHALPAEARQALTQLMVRLILGHADNRRVAEREEMQCDV